MGILILVFFVILFVLLYQKKIFQHKALLKENETNYQRRLLTTSSEVAEQERKRIASNIHDDVGMLLNVLKLNLSKIDRNLTNEELVKETLRDSKAIIQDSITGIRSISYDLMPPTLVKLGFIKGIEDMCLQINNIQLIQISLRIDLKELSIGKNNELQLYRLVKEILNNIIKHADASLIDLFLAENKNNLITVISHNGKGITTKEAYELSVSSSGIGLKSIFNRVHLTNSTIEYTVGENSQIVIQTPLS